MTLTTITAPAAEPLALSDMKEHLRVTWSTEDAKIGRFIASARAAAENYLRARLITQIVRMSRDGFCSDWHRGPEINIPVGPVQSVVQIGYTDAAGVEQVLDGAAYRLVASRTPNELHPAYGMTWPVPRDQADNVRIDLVVGYGDASVVPATILQAMRLQVAAWYKNSEPGAEMDLSGEVAQILSDHRFWV